ncbi:nucleotidyl transferase AbiEii/AbiGii toxin family protein [Arcobacter vandammei]|uniref:nucleotidyl transferase AbiEii/AbiGii toxin family protein n=1 Tax=Arcobacter vandammei TaxID=2782243 RepID=UPI0018DF7144|nr:nucleotidyl transferase AbiEii/AbiGii toxin family protein [Arcobacter vandammei]
MANLHPHIEAMLNRYDLSKDEPFDALREILQEIVLYALYEAGFFKYATFYGGTALRILYKLPRFSEDLDFSLLKPDSSFDLSKYEKTILTTLNNYGFECSIDTKIKTNSDIQSAFLKTNTLQQLISINAPKDIVAKYPPTKQLKIKFEVDTNPPLDFEVEEKLHLVPIAFQIKTMKISSLFAGKIHAILCRAWGTRPKGRDWYDLVWYVRNDYKVNITHLEARLKQSCKAFDNEIKDFSQNSIMELLNKRIESLDISMAKDDVSRFIYDQRELELWSNEFFKTIVSMVKFA